MKAYVQFCLIGSVGVLANSTWPPGSIVDQSRWLGGGRGRGGDERPVELCHVHPVRLAAR